MFNGEQMLIGSILGWELGCDDLFDSRSKRNRDDCLEPMRTLQKFAESKNVELHTDDVISHLGLTPDFALYVESVPFIKGYASKNYLIRYETSLTVPLNNNVDYLKNFDGIFTWDLDLLEGKGLNADFRAIERQRLVEIRTPNPLPEEFDRGVPEYIERSIFCCLIGSNRHANIDDKRELYSERVRAIKWFERHAPSDFQLFGNGWKVPQKRHGFWGKVKYRSEKIMPFLMGKPVFSSYRGPIEIKQSVLRNSKFCICFENARDIRGYLTEKIFDCLFAGCVPIYWGEPNIEEWLPKECFIDFRKFSSYDALYHFLNKISPKSFKSYQAAGRNFINSQDFIVHSSQSFASRLINRVLVDFH